MSVGAIRGFGAVEGALRNASQATGVDFDFLVRTARRESSFNPSAKAPTSSAAGLFQFVEQTWLATVKQHGAKHGLQRFADMISRGADGRYRVTVVDADNATLIDEDTAIAWPMKRVAKDFTFPPAEPCVP